MLDNETFHQPAGLFGSLGCAAIFLLIPITGAVGTSYDRTGPEGAALAVGGSLLALLLVHAFFAEDTTAILDARGLRLVHQRRVFGLRGREKLAWEIPARALTEAEEIKYHRPGRDGGWQTSIKLHLPGSVVLEPALLGGPYNADTPYKKLVATLERRLGPKFVRLDDFGPLGRRPAGSPPPQR